MSNTRPAYRRSSPGATGDRGPIRSPTPGRAKSYLGLQVDADVDADDHAGTPLVAQELVEVERALPVKASGQGGSRMGSPIGWG
ncbi:hypothetical protein [Caballeronia mineralivorans]|uniref:hypothetical protein n=1 Tax=Caballeronia mineralivorans TaxID=2010198 RepID=UPI0023F3BB9E|nr:hypothetical protein [Caballeronia mineralivorans]